MGSEDYSCNNILVVPVWCHNEEKPKINKVNMANFNAIYISPLSDGKKEK